MLKTELYEIAAHRGFYGGTPSGLFGIKDNVRKYWEDTFIKLSLRAAVEQILAQKGKIRILDLGCGSGDGIELLTHIPTANPFEAAHKDFVLTPLEIDFYKGLDISATMLAQGQRNYPNLAHIRFEAADLAAGLPCAADEPYDLYFSSYCALSPLTCQELEALTQAIFAHAGARGYLVFDLHGRYSPEWPQYWEKNCQTQSPYNTAYLLPPSEQTPEQIQWFDVTYWNDAELIQMIGRAARATRRSAQILALQDRSILIGRHMETTLFKSERQQFRQQVNRLFDHDHRGEINVLNVDLDYLEDVKSIQPQAWHRIMEYRQQWQTVVMMLQALMTNHNANVKKLIETSPNALTEELKMLAWLYRNADRFPVPDFWASVIGPQVACVLRNLELNLPMGLGCGHSLFCLVEIR